MRLTCTHDRYGAVAITIHWLSAVLIAILLVSGFRAAGSEDAAVKLAWLKLHLPIALLVLLLTLLRIVWWLGFDDKPDRVAGALPSDRRLAGAVHLLLYVVVLGMAASGIGMTLASGAAALIFGGEGGLLPNFWRYPPRVPHGVGARLLIALLLAHLVAALYHHYIRRDELLRRMWFRP